ncbi:unnamed protein product, partial [Staurois parvus]
MGHIHISAFSPGAFFGKDQGLFKRKYFNGEAAEKHVVWFCCICDAFCILIWLATRK